MKLHRYEYIYRPIDRFILRLNPTTRRVLLTLNLALAAILLLAQFNFFNLI